MVRGRHRALPALHADAVVRSRLGVSQAAWSRARTGHATSHCSIWALNRMKTLACKPTERDSPTSVRLAYYDGLLTDLLVAELIRD
jgi:hypothetical protein